MAYILRNNIRPHGLKLSNINVKGEEIKYVKNGSGNLFYDIQREINYDEPSVAVMYPLILIPSSGGHNSPSMIDYRQTWRRVGYSEDEYELEEIINTDGTLTFSVIDGEGASVNSSSGLVTWESRGVEYGASPRFAEIELLVELNGLIGKASDVVSLDINIITGMLLLNVHPGSLKPVPELEAWESMFVIESDAPATSDCLLTFSSGDSTLDYEKFVDFKVEYTWESNLPYVIILPEQTGESCLVKIESRGIEFDFNSRTAIVTRKAKITAKLKEPYIQAEEVTEETQCTIDVIQKPNLITIKEFTATAGSIKSPDVFHAYEETKLIENVEASESSGILEFSSKEIVTNIEYYGKKTLTYSWESDLEYAIVNNVNEASTTVTMSSRDVVVGPERSAIITRCAKQEYDLFAVYGEGHAEVEQCTTTTVNLEENKVTLKDFTVNPGSIKAPDTYSAGEETKTIESEQDSTVTGTLIFTSKETVIDLSTYGELVLIYSWSSDLSYASVNNLNSASTTVTMSSRTTGLGAERSATITRCANWKFTISEIYGEGSINDTKCCTTTIKQQGNYVSKVEALVTDSTLGSHFYYPSINEYGGTVSPVGNGSHQFWLSSGAGPYTSLPGVSVSTSRTYAVVTSNSYASLNTITGVITWSPNKINSKLYVTIGSTYSVSCTGGGVTVSDSLYGTATAMMEEVKIVYSVPVLSLYSSTTISAGGGSIKKSELDIRYSQIKTTYLPSGKKDEILTSGGEFTYELYDANGNAVLEVSGEDLLKNVLSRTYKGYITASVTMNGKTGTSTWNIYQEANVVILDTNASLSYDGVDYNGGNDYPNLSHSCRVYYTSGSYENRLYGGSTTYSSGKLTITTSSYSAGTVTGATFRESDGRVKWEAHESKSSRSLTVYIDVYVTFEYINNMFSNIIDNQYLHADSILAGKPDLKLEGEGLSCSAIGTTELGYESGNSTSFKYEMWYSASWNIKPDEDIRIYLDDLYDYNFSITNQSYFSVDSSGVVTTLKENSGNSPRTATLTFTYTYISPNSGKYLTEDISMTITLSAKRYNLTINNTTGASIILSTNGSLEGQAAKLYDGDIILINQNTYSVDITNGINTKDGNITSSCTIYIYIIDGDDKLAKAGSFTYSPNEDITVSI